MTMNNTDFIKTVKNATVAIGLRDADDLSNKVPLALSGTGFLIDDAGYVLTATHVVENAYKNQTELKKQGKNSHLSMFSYIQKDGSGFSFILNSIVQVQTLIVTSEGITNDLDIACCKLNDPEPYPVLEIATKLETSLLDGIGICGYPLGEISLNFTPDVAQAKTSPLLLTGKISAFTPADNAPVKIDLISDIIGVSGLSGSPIIDLERKKVIGISQYVLSTPVFLYKEQGKQSGIASSGYICGKTCDMMAVIQSTIQNMKAGKKPSTFSAKYPKME